MVSLPETQFSGQKQDMCVHCKVQKKSVTLVKGMRSVIILLTSHQWRRAWQPSPEFLPGESHGQRSLGGYRPWGRRGSEATYQLNDKVTAPIRTMAVCSSAEVPAGGRWSRLPFPRWCEPAGTSFTPDTTSLSPPRSEEDQQSYCYSPWISRTI